MRRTATTAILALCLSIAAMAQQARALKITGIEADTICVPYSDIDNVHFGEGQMTVETKYNTYSTPVASVQDFTPTSLSTPLAVKIYYNEDKVSYMNALAHRGVTVAVDGGNVTIDNPITDEEVTVTLTGTHSDGSLTYNGSYKMTLQLAGVSLTSQTGAAIDIECSKRIAVVLAKGTENTLANKAKGKQKAALYFKGHPEFEGAGTLNVTGNAKHAISAKEYIQLKKSVGSINILASASDGIHAGQYFQMNGGTLTMDNLAGDGIQAEATTTPDDEQNGQMIIKGGTLAINCAGDDVACLKADSLITISGGTFSLTATGKTSKGIKTNGDISISGGTINATCTGDGELYDPTSTGSAESYCVYVSVPSSSAGGRPGPGGPTSSEWGTIYIYDNSGTRLGTLSSSVKVTANGRTTTFYCHDFRQPTEGTFHFGAPDYTSGGWGGSTGTTYAIKSATIPGPTDGNNHFYTISSTYTTSGSTRTYNISDVTATYQNGTIASDGSESHSSNGIKADGSLTITGGDITITATGKGGKGINIDGDIVIGEPGTEGPTVIASTSGTVIASSGSGMNEKLTGQPKAIKAQGDITINSGKVTATTKSNGGEGIESKSAITFNGGVTVCDTYDDGINAALKVTFNDGIIWAHSSGNDGIDCNGRDGFEFNGGTILSSGTNAPEEGFDCDNNSFVINGGTLIGTGGATSNPTSAKQPYKTQSSQSITAGTYLSLQKSDGTVICSYRVPKTLNSATVLVSSPEFQSGTTYKLVRNSTAVSNPTATYLDGTFTTGGTLTGGTSTNITPTTK